MSNQPDIRDVVYYGSEVSKASIKEQSINLLKDLDEGHITPLQLAAQLKFVEDVITNVKEELRQRVVAEQSKYGKERMSYQGASFDIKEAGVKYDYSQCQDEKWNEINILVEGLTEERKEREAFLKTLKSSFTYIDETTGEIVTLNPPQRKSTTTYSITWNKE